MELHGIDFEETQLEAPTNDGFIGTTVNTKLLPDINITPDSYRQDSELGDLYRFLDTGILPSQT